MVQLTHNIPNKNDLNIIIIHNLCIAQLLIIFIQ